MLARVVALLLLVLLAAIQVQLWVGRGSMHHVHELRQRIAEQQAANAHARQENQRLASEVQDLKEGLETIEEKARSELGMVKQGEIFVQVVRGR